MSDVSLSRAAQILRDEALSLRRCHTVDGDWTGEPDAKAAHDEMLAAADEVDAALSRIEALERERDEWRQACEQAAREVNALQALRRDATRWRAVRHAFHLDARRNDAVLLTTHWMAWVDGQHATVTDAIDAYAAQNAQEQT